MITHGISDALYSARNIGRLGSILDAFVAGMVSTDDVAWGTPKACILALQGLVNAWLSPKAPAAPENVVTVFRQWIFETLTPATFRCTGSASFDASDAGCASVLVRICSLHKDLCARCGDVWIEFVKSTYLPSVGCPPAMAEAYAAALRSSAAATEKQLRDEFRRIFLAQ